MASVAANFPQSGTLSRFFSGDWAAIQLAAEATDGVGNDMFPRYDIILTAEVDILTHFYHHC